MKRMLGTNAVVSACRRNGLMQGGFIALARKNNVAKTVYGQFLKARTDTVLVIAHSLARRRTA